MDNCCRCGKYVCGKTAEIVEGPGGEAVLICEGCSNKAKTEASPGTASAGHRSGVVRAVADYMHGGGIGAGSKPQGTSRVYTKRRQRDQAERRARRQKRGLFDVE